MSTDLREPRGLECRALSVHGLGIGRCTAVNYTATQGDVTSRTDGRELGVALARPYSAYNLTCQTSGDRTCVYSYKSHLLYTRQRYCNTKTYRRYQIGIDRDGELEIKNPAGRSELVMDTF